MSSLLWQSSAPQNTKQAGAAFDAILDILQHQVKHAASLGLPASYSQQASVGFEAMAQQALSLGDTPSL